MFKPVWNAFLLVRNSTVNALNIFRGTAAFSQDQHIVESLSSLRRYWQSEYPKASVVLLLATGRPFTHVFHECRRSHREEERKKICCSAQLADLQSIPRNAALVKIQMEFFAKTQESNLLVIFNSSHYRPTTCYFCQQLWIFELVWTAFLLVRNSSTAELMSIFNKL